MRGLQNLATTGAMKREGKGNNEEAHATPDTDVFVVLNILLLFHHRCWQWALKI